MSDVQPEPIFQPEPIVTRLFNRLRREFNLGLREYLAALDAVRGGYGAEHPDSLKSVLQLLWCHSVAERSQFAVAWDAIAIEQPKPPAKTTEKPSGAETKPEPPSEPRSPVPPAPETPPKAEEQAALKPLPIQPPLLPTDSDDAPELRLYFPVSRRSMTYLWRYLRRTVADGVADVLDIQATVRQVARQGFFLAPVYRRREVNRAHLLLLIDQGGSMTPFHRFSRDLVETAQTDSTLEQVDVFYFHNLPFTTVYQDAHLTVPVSLESAIARCDHDTSVLIVSDAGAARGYRRIERIRETTEFLGRMKQQTTLISWLNPMPKERWSGSSAEVLAYLVPMQQMNDDGLSNAIDIVRGQSLSHLHGEG